MNDEEREYLNEMIRGLNSQLVDALRERDEARRDAERWRADALRLIKERNAAMEERDEARREVCKWECRCRPMSERDYAASRKWDCFPPRKMFEGIKP